LSAISNPVNQWIEGVLLGVTAGSTDMNLFTDSAGLVQTQASSWYLSVAGIRGTTGSEGLQGPRGVTGQNGVTFLYESLPSDGSLGGGQVLALSTSETLSTVPISYDPENEESISVNAPMTISSLSSQRDFYALWLGGRTTDTLLRIQDIGHAFGRPIMIVNNGRVEMRNPVIGVNSVGSTSGRAFVPSATGSEGITGQISFDSNYFYVCVGNNNWKRAGLTGW
jgi:hypothetical protein